MSDTSFLAFRGVKINLFMIFRGGDSWPALVWKMKTNLTKLMFENLENNYNVLIINVLTL